MQSCALQGSCANWDLPYEEATVLLLPSFRVVLDSSQVPQGAILENSRLTGTWALPSIKALSQVLQLHTEAGITRWLCSTHKASGFPALSPALPTHPHTPHLHVTGASP